MENVSKSLEDRIAELEARIETLERFIDPGRALRARGVLTTTRTLTDAEREELQRAWNEA